MTEEEKNLVEALAPFGIDAIDIIFLRAGDMLGPRAGANFFAAISRLVEERDEALTEVREYLEPRLQSMKFDSGNFDMELTGKTVEGIAVAFVSYFKAENGGDRPGNYLELNVFDRDEPFQRYTVTVQKVGKLSPADKERAAQARATAAEASLAEAREALKPFASHAERYEPYEGDGHHQAWQSVFTIGDVRRARRSLGEQE